MELWLNGWETDASALSPVEGYYSVTYRNAIGDTVVRTVWARTPLDARFAVIRAERGYNVDVIRIAGPR